LPADAALFQASQRMSVGVVIRDHNGACLLACHKRITEVTTPELAETLALRRAVALTRHEGFQMAIFVLDCLSVIQRVNSPSADRSTGGAMIADINIMADSFSSGSFNHVSNAAAHILARSCESYGDSILHNITPKCIREALCLDIT
jgi:hypothetical protein